MAEEGTNKASCEWEMALREFEDLRKASEAGRPTKPEGMQRSAYEARARLMATRSPNLAALAKKVELIWGPENLWSDDENAADGRRLIGDLRRLAFVLEAGGTFEEWDSEPPFD
jgi:hypothetical protein